MLLVALLVFRAPSGPAAREIATREPDGSEWSISKPARALRPLRRPPRRRRLRCWGVAWCVVSKPGQALPPPTSCPCRSLLLVAPLVFRAPSGPAAREIATREPDGSEWSISKPALALRTLRRPPRRRRLRCWECRLEARPGSAAAHERRSLVDAAIVRLALSHAIPLSLFQYLNWHRWNCNVSGFC